LKIIINYIYIYIYVKPTKISNNRMRLKNTVLISDRRDHLEWWKNIL